MNGVVALWISDKTAWKDSITTIHEIKNHHLWDYVDQLFGF